MNANCKAEHAEGILFLKQALDAADQAHSNFKIAKTEGSIETGSGPYRVTISRVVGILESLVKEAEAVECDDCQKKIADCACAWSNEVLR